MKAFYWMTMGVLLWGWVMRYHLPLWVEWLVLVNGLVAACVATWQLLSLVLVGWRAKR